MNKRAVISVIALVALGAGTGFLWRKLERARAAELAQAPAVPTVAANAEPAATTAAEQLSAKEPRASTNAAGAARTGVSQVPASPADLQKLAEIRKKLVEEYPDLATELQLAPEEAERLLDLLARQQLQLSELIAARPGSSRDGVYSASLSREMSAMELSDDAEQAAMLAGKYPEWLQYQEAQLQRNPVDQLQGVLGRQGITLSDADIDPLLAALAAEQKRLNKDTPGASEPLVTSRRQQLEQELQYAANNRQLVKVASRYLNPQQLDAYQQLLAQRTRTAQRLLRTMEEAGE